MTSMEFWGVEVKPGQTLSCGAGNGFIIRLTQAALGETEKGNVSTVVSAKVDDIKVVIGTLSAENCPQILFDLVFEKEFELSHSSETASVFLCGHKMVMPDLPESGSSKDEVGLKTVNNQVINPNADEDESDSTSLDDFSSDDDLTEDDSSSEDDSSEDDDTSSEEDDTSTEEDDTSSEEDDTSSEESDTSSEEDSSSDKEEIITYKKLEDSKKRVAKTTWKTLLSDKKAKIATPSGQTTGDDKNVPHVATPHPAKQASEAARVLGTATASLRRSPPNPSAPMPASRAPGHLEVTQRSSPIRRQSTLDLIATTTCCELFGCCCISNFCPLISTRLAFLVLYRNLELGNILLLTRLICLALS